MYYCCQILCILIYQILCICSYRLQGFCRRHNEEMVSHERIYQYVWADKKARGTLFTYLRCKGWRYRKRGAYKDSRGIILNRIDIDNCLLYTSPSPRDGLLSRMPS